jgi:hypothetical protein
MNTAFGDMNFLHKLFGGTKPVRAIDTSGAGMTFLGSPQGSGVRTLLIELGAILQRDVRVKCAYLSGVTYAEDKRQRLALVLSTQEEREAVAASVGGACASSGLTPIDILFLEDLSAPQQKYFAAATPFYASNG